MAGRQMGGGPKQRAVQEGSLGAIRICVMWGQKVDEKRKYKCGEMVREPRGWRII